MAEPSGIGEQIRSLREAAGMSGQQLADLVDLDPSAVTRIESGERQVKSGELVALASALKVSALAILQPDSLLAKLPLANRFIDDDVSQGTVHQRIVGLTELHEVLKDAGISERPNLNNIPKVNDDWLESARSLATWAHQQLGFSEKSGPRFGTLVESIGSVFRTDVLVEPHESDSLLGATLISREFPLIVVNSHGQSRQRALFTLAHELGHLLSSEEEKLVQDRDLRTRDADERLANAFASEFLMPEPAVLQIVDGLGGSADSLAEMILRFGISYESLIYRLHNIRLINAAERDALLRSGWSGLLNQVKDEDKLARLSGSRAVDVERRPPLWITDRALRGYKASVLSIKPYAGLVGEQPEVLRERDDATVLMVESGNEPLGQDWSSALTMVKDDAASCDAEPLGDDYQVA
ncbi:MAG: helix-turn-helix domain-containing protein [Acidimicrobiales bacterium]